MRCCCETLGTTLDEHHFAKVWQHSQDQPPDCNEIPLRLLFAHSQKKTNISNNKNITILNLAMVCLKLARKSRGQKRLGHAQFGMGPFEWWSKQQPRYGDNQMPSPASKSQEVARFANEIGNFVDHLAHCAPEFPEGQSYRSKQMHFLAATIVFSLLQILSTL